MASRGAPALGASLVASLWLALASPVCAQAIELAVDAGGVDAVAPEALRDALAAELGERVALVDASTPGRGAMRLTLRPRGARAATLELTRADGSRLRRRTRLERDGVERLATLVILAANMVRDEAGELLALLRARGAGAGPAAAGAEAGPAAAPAGAAASSGEVEAPEEEPTASVFASSSDPASTPSADPRPGPAGADEAPRAASEGAPDGSAVEPTPPGAVAAEPPPSEVAAGASGPSADGAGERASAGPYDPVLRLGLDGQVGSVPAPGSSLEVVWLAGLHAAWTPLPFLAIGVREVGGGLSRTRRYHVGGAPFVELAWRLDDVVDLHGALGVHVQLVDGASGSAAGVAPLVVAGVRLFPVPFFSIAVETDVRVVATDLFHSGIELVPQGTVLWTGGLSIAFHL